MSKKCLISLTTLIILILGLTPCHRAAMEDILKSKDTISADRRNLVLEELVQKCFVSDEKFLVIVNEGIDEKLIIHFHRLVETAIVSIVFSNFFVEDSYSTALRNGNWFPKGTYYRDQWKSKGFLVSAVSISNLQEKFEKLKYTRWWNSAGYFLIFEETIDNNPMASVPITNSSGCSNAYDYLSLAWKYNILSVVFLCQEVDKNLTMYSFDPFGNDLAPSQWVKAREMKGRQNHPWILFKWEKYNGIKNSSCAVSEIFFDKKKSLNGYPILVNAIKSPPFVNINNKKSEVSKYTGEDGWTVNVIWEILNGKLVEVHLPSEDNMPGWISDNGTVRGSLVDIVSGKVDMSMNSLTVGHLTWRTTTTYPHTSLNTCFVTKDKGEIPWLIGLIYVIDKWSMIAGFTVFTIAVVTFGYIDDRRYGSGFMNALRVFISSSYVLRPSIIQPKFIICFLLLLPLTSYSTIQGKILSLIQNPSHYANIDTEEELLKSGMKFGGPEYLKNIFIPPQLIPNYRSTDSTKSCLHDLNKNEEPSACFSYCDNLVVAISRDNRLHLASERSVYYPNRYVARPDFPLIERFDEILRRMVEVGLYRHYRTDSFQQETSDEFLDRFKNPSSTDTADSAATISLKDFSYVFISLGIGWLSAILVFIIELILGQSKKPDKIIIKNPEGISPGLTAESHRIIRRISRKEKWPNHF